jgi:hypothetical protein
MSQSQNTAIVAAPVVSEEPVQPQPTVSVEERESVPTQIIFETIEKAPSTIDEVEDGELEAPHKVCDKSGIVDEYRSSKRSADESGIARKRSRNDNSWRSKFIDRIHFYRHAKRWDNVKKTYGTDYLNFVHFRLAEEGKYEELYERFLELENVHTFFLPVLFEDAYLYLTRESFVFEESRRTKMNALVEQTESEKSKSLTRSSLFDSLDRYFRSGPLNDKPMSSHFVKLESSLLDKYREGKFEDIHRLLELYELSSVGRGKIQSLFRRMYNYLKRS